MKKTLLTLLILCTAAFSQAKSDFGMGTMTANAGLSFSAFGFGYGASFEFGLTETIGVQAGVTLNSWDNGAESWSIVPIDLFATYHTTPIGFGDTGYYMAGVSLVNFSVEKSGFSDESATATLVGLGYGGTKEINDMLDFYFEARYRLGVLEAGSYKAAIAWYSLGAGISYSL